MRWTALCLLLLVVTLAGCAPSLPRDHAERLIAVRDALLDYPEGEIPSSKWPQAVAELKPKRVYRKDEGLYIITYEFFVEQRGVLLATRDMIGQSRKLGEQDRRLNLGHPQVASQVIVVIPGRPFGAAAVAEAATQVGQLFVVRYQDATLAGRDIL